MAITEDKSASRFKSYLTDYRLHLYVRFGRVTALLRAFANAFAPRLFSSWHCTPVLAFSLGLIVMDTSLVLRLFKDNSRLFRSCLLMTVDTKTYLKESYTRDITVTPARKQVKRWSVCLTISLFVMKIYFKNGWSD